MAGGLFGRPFAFNIKCIIFSLIIISIFFYKPTIQNNYLAYGVSFGLFVISYVAMAWYDSVYNCDILPLKKGSASFQRFLKPEAHESKKQEEHMETAYETSLKYKLIYLAHIFFIVPVLGYVAYYGKKTPKTAFIIVGVLTAFTLVYHGLHLMYSMHLEPKQKEVKEN